jgi:hypothetical protein
MAKQTKLPTIVMGRSMAGSAPTEKDPKVTFELGQKQVRFLRSVFRFVES